MIATILFVFLTMLVMVYIISKCFKIIYSPISLKGDFLFSLVVAALFMAFALLSHIWFTLVELWLN